MEAARDGIVVRQRNRSSSSTYAVSDTAARGLRRPRDRERDEYMNHLAAETIPPGHRPFYLLRVEQFVAALNGRDPEPRSNAPAGVAADGTSARAAPGRYSPAAPSASKPDTAFSRA